MMSELVPVFSYDIICLDVVPLNSPFTNVIKTIYFNYTATYDKYQTTIPSTASLPDVDSSNFISYDDVTKDILVSWIETYSCELSTLQRLLTNNISVQLKDNIVHLPPPFLKKE